MSIHRIKKGGYIALASVIIFSALLLLVGIGSSLRGIDVENSIIGEESSYRAETLAHACAEEALMKLKSNLGYTGNETIIVDGGDTCQVVSVDGVGNTDRVVLTRADNNSYVRNVRVDVARVNPNLLLRTWLIAP